MSEPKSDAPEPGEASLRVDKWLWYARFFKTRSLAAKFVNGGKIRIRSGEISVRATKSSHTVRVNDVLTFPKGDHIRVIKILDPGKRRGPAPEAQGLYEDLAPPQPKPKKPAVETPAARDKGSGRPTKKQRRQTDKLKDD